MGLTLEATIRDLHPCAFKELRIILKIGTRFPSNILREYTGLVMVSYASCHNPETEPTKKNTTLVLRKSDARLYSI
jgi:hypothetical protein